MSSVLLEPPELDTKGDAELGYLQTEVPSVAITHDHSGVRHIIEVHPCDDVCQHIEEDLGGHPAIGGVADAPLSCDPVHPHVLEPATCQVPGPLVDKSGRNNVSAGYDGVGPGDVLLTAATLIVEHVTHPNRCQDLGVLGTSCQGGLVLKYINIFHMSMTSKTCHFT